MRRRRRKTRSLEDCQTDARMALLWPPTLLLHHLETENWVFAYRRRHRCRHITSALIGLACCRQRSRWRWWSSRPRSGRLGKNPRWVSLFTFFVRLFLTFRENSGNVVFPELRLLCLNQEDGLFAFYDPEIKIYLLFITKHNFLRCV